VYQPVIKPLAIKYINTSKSLLLLVILVLLNASVFAQKTSQKRKQLENERKTLLARIGETKKVLAENKEKENTKLTELKAINAQIKTREKVINNIGQEIFEISVEVNESKTTIDTLKAQLARLKKDYANNMVAIYKNKNNLNDLAFIFNAEGFNDAYKRIKYLDKLSEYKQLQARLIVNIQKSIEDEMNNMLQVKKQSEQLYFVKEGEKKELEVDKKIETKVLTALQQKQKVLQEEQAQNERNFQKLSQKISDLIQKEIEDAKRREEERRRIANEKSDVERAKLLAENKKKGIETKPEVKKVPESSLSPDDLLTNANFENMKNRLPWPVNNGYIAEGFGTHQHPTLKAIYTTNNGINIACKKETTVRSVFKGKVKAIFEVPGMEKIILVKHGEYFTVYNNLGSVSVSKGQKVSTGQTIGTADVDSDTGVPMVDFSVYQGATPLNPMSWLAR
jgi:septal ring factor EnvC (AmiA/AmiB activator)